MECTTLGTTSPRRCRICTIEALLLAHEAAVARDLVEAIQLRFKDEPATFAVEVFDGAWGSKVREERRARGPCPIGVCTPNEETALEALAAGADEAIVFASRPDGPSIHAFVDRTLLRAGLRREDERRKDSLSHAEKLTALGAVVAGVAHEINNPLCSILLGLDMIGLAIEPPLTREDESGGLGRGMDGGASHEVGATLREIGEAVATVSAIVRDLKIFARPDQEERPQVVNVKDLIDQVLRLVRTQVEGHAVLERDLGESLPLLLLPPTRIAQVLTNVLINAAHAVREVDRPLHRIRVSARADEEAVAIVVSDTGPGILATDVERIFDPFYTTKRQEMGTGLGLSISRAILRELGGDLLVESVHGEGASFVTLLPRPPPSDERLREAAAPRAPRPASRSRLSVLVVDDDERMLRAYGRALGAAHDVVTASDGGEAIDLLSSGTVADVIVSEIGMPGVDGPQLYLWLRSHRPELAARTLFVTAFDAPSAVLEEAKRPVLSKPIDRARLLDEIERLADATRCPLTPE